MYESFLVPTFFNEDPFFIRAFTIWLFCCIFLMFSSLHSSHKWKSEIALGITSILWFFFLTSYFYIRVIFKEFKDTYTQCLITAIVALVLCCFRTCCLIHHYRYNYVLFFFILIFSVFHFGTHTYFVESAAPTMRGYDKGCNINITVLSILSHSKDHPCTSLFELTLGSFNYFIPELIPCPKIIVLNNDISQEYKENLRQLNIPNAKFVDLPIQSNLVHAMRVGLSYIQTELVFVQQYDQRLLKRPENFEQLILPDY